MFSIFLVSKLRKFSLIFKILLILGFDTWRYDSLFFGFSFSKPFLSLKNFDFYKTSLGGLAVIEGGSFMISALLSFDFSISGTGLRFLLLGMNLLDTSYLKDDFLSLVYNISHPDL